jgi:hypothetical protein
LVITNLLFFPIKHPNKLIVGEIPLNYEFLLKKEPIGGKIPSIGSKHSNMEGFALNNRKISPYLPRNKVLSTSNRKKSA